MFTKHLAEVSSALVFSIVTNTHAYAETAMDGIVVNFWH
jgi:hypothetical protein